MNQHFVEDSVRDLNDNVRARYYLAGWVAQLITSFLILASFATLALVLGPSIRSSFWGFWVLSGIMAAIYQWRRYRRGLTGEIASSERTLSSPRSLTASAFLSSVTLMFYGVLGSPYATPQTGRAYSEFALFFSGQTLLMVAFCVGLAGVASQRVRLYAYPAYAHLMIWMVFGVGWIFVIAHFSMRFLGALW